MATEVSGPEVSIQDVRSQLAQQLALTLIVLRSRDAHVAANLSGMAQGIGYTVASMGPFAVGLVHELTGGWDALGWIFGVVGIGAIIAGLGAGRAKFVNVVSEKV